MPSDIGCSEISGEMTMMVISSCHTLCIYVFTDLIYSFNCERFLKAHFYFFLIRQTQLIHVHTPKVC